MENVWFLALGLKIYQFKLDLCQDQQARRFNLRPVEEVEMWLFTGYWIARMRNTFFLSFSGFEGRYSHVTSSKCRTLNTYKYWINYYK